MREVVQRLHFFMWGQVKTRALYFLLCMSLTSCEAAFFDPFGIGVNALSWRKIEKPSATGYAAHFEDWYSALGKIFPKEPETPIRVYNYIARVQQLEYAGAGADMSIDYQVIGEDTSAIHLGHQGVCGHELVHIFQSRTGNAPALLMEGLAVALAGAHWEGETEPYTYVYCIGGSFVHFLVSKYQEEVGIREGWEMYIELYEKASSSVLTGLTVDDAVYSVYGRSLVELEEEWRGELEVGPDSSLFGEHF